MTRRALAVIVAAVLLSGGAAGYLLLHRPPVQTHASRPLTWFSPLPPMPERPGRPFVGSPDFMDLFTPSAPWPHAASDVDVFALYGEWIGGTATDAQLAQVVADLRRRHIAIGFEAGPLTPTTCGSGVEGFSGPQVPAMARRIKDAGGVAAYETMDEPFWFAVEYDGANACHWTPSAVAAQIRDWLHGLRGVFHAIKVGDVEPLVPGMTASDYETWLDAYRSATGEDVAFLRMDVDVQNRPDWPQVALALEAWCRGRGIPFAMIYDGFWQDDTDAAWIAHAQDMATTFESLYGGRPDQVVFQSWEDKPDHTLPETSATSFTHLVLDYFRTRTNVTLAVTSGPGAVTGTLTETAAGGARAPIPGATVHLSARPLAGPGVYAVYSAAGTVPGSATSAVVGYRVNTECGCASPSDFALYSIRYAQADGANRVSNADFSARLSGWSPWGTATPAIEPSDHGGGRMLHVTATAAQTAAINSALFPVTAGAAFAVDFAARVAPASIGSGFFTVIFLTPSTEVSRVVLRIEPATVALEDIVTGGNGAFTETLAGLPVAAVLILVRYDGDDQRWPALAQVTVS